MEDADRRDSDRGIERVKERIAIMVPVRWDCADGECVAFRWKRCDDVLRW